MFLLCHTAIAFAAAIVCALASSPSASLGCWPWGRTGCSKIPSQAAAVAVAGDIVRIDPGTYTDCAFCRASRLLIEAAGAGVRIAGNVCARRRSSSSRAMTSPSVASPSPMPLWHNAAGIRVEGQNLTVESSRCVGSGLPMRSAEGG